MRQFLRKVINLNCYTVGEIQISKQLVLYLIYDMLGMPWQDERIQKCNYNSFKLLDVLGMSFRQGKRERNE